MVTSSTSALANGGDLSFLARPPGAIFGGSASGGTSTTPTSGGAQAHPLLARLATMLNLASARDTHQNCVRWSHVLDAMAAWMRRHATAADGRHPVGPVHHLHVSGAVRVACGSVRRDCCSGSARDGGRSESVGLWHRRVQGCSLVFRQRASVHLWIGRTCGALKSGLWQEAKRILLPASDCASHAFSAGGQLLRCSSRLQAPQGAADGGDAAAGTASETAAASVPASSLGSQPLSPPPQTGMLHWLGAALVPSCCTQALCQGPA